MLSIPHMIVIFVVVLVVFGPQKLPELARGLGKLMAELRKASGDFRSAFDQEMRDMDRQAREAEWKKQQATEAAGAPGAQAPQLAATAEQTDGGAAAAAETVPRDAEGQAAAAETAGPVEKPADPTVPVTTEGGEPPHGIV
jgi:sec-independent protein translocase protein TatB